MAKIKAGDNVAYTPTKAESAIPTVDGKVLGEIISVDANAVVLKSGDDSFTVSKNTRRFKKVSKLPADTSDTASVKKPGPKTPVATTTAKTKPIRPGSKKHRAIEIYKEINGDETEAGKLDRTAVKARFETELELGAQGSSTYYQNIKSRQNGWWF
jgi:hypothetical protein